MRRPVVRLQQQADRVLEEAPELGEELGPECAVHHSVVAAEGHVHAAPDLETVLDDDRDLPDRADREDAALRGVDDGGELVDAGTAQVRDRKRRPRQVAVGQLAGAGADDKVAQAVPSVAPISANKYFKKIECFCFENQAFAANEARPLPLQFIVDPELPDYVDTITLSYTLYDTGNTYVTRTR